MHRVAKERKIKTPKMYEGRLSSKCAVIADKHREEVRKIVSCEDDRLLVVVGPCSIHDIRSAVEYGDRLKAIQAKCPKLLLVMRVYFEKPRTTTGWKGLINDPLMDDSFNISHGLELARRLCEELVLKDIPIATEVLDPYTPKYLHGLFSWVAIGARTTESQTHREIASGLPMPVGFKNGTSGDISVATNAMLSAAHKHRYLGLSRDGEPSIISANGNKDTHVILRGGADGPNYSEGHIISTSFECMKHGLSSKVMVDCSHANAEGDFNKQKEIALNVVKDSRDWINGLMLESNIVEGNQKISDDMVYGQSVTDPCINIEDTEKLLVEINSLL